MSTTNFEITYSHTCVRSPNRSHIHLGFHRIDRAPGRRETFPSILALSATSLVNNIIIVIVSHADIV